MPRLAPERALRPTDPRGREEKGLLAARVLAVEEADLEVLIVVLDEAGGGKHVVHRSAGVLALYGLLTACGYPVRWFGRADQGTN